MAFINDLQTYIKNITKKSIEYYAEQEDMSIKDYIAETYYDSIFDQIIDRIQYDGYYYWDKNDKYDRADLIKKISTNFEKLMYIIGGSRFNDYEIYNDDDRRQPIWSYTEDDIDFCSAMSILDLAEGALIDEYCLDLADKYGCELNV